MHKLSQKQKQLFDLLNRSRLALTKQFRNNHNPNIEIFLQELIIVEAALFESANQNTDLMKEVGSNIKTLLFNYSQNDKGEDQVRKAKVKWQRKQKRQTQIVQPNKKEFQNQQKIKQEFNNKPNNQTKNRQNVLNKNVAQFVSANILPKGTSVRKKFVPPFKKVESKEGNIMLKDEGTQEQKTFDDPRYKNLQPKLVTLIESQILDKGEKSGWESIAGLGFAKKIIHEIIVWPMLRPDIFTGLRAPPKGILLFGPPGTGKTLIGRTIASEASATFFNISASSLTSKWVGESEKLVKTLFSIARIKQPSVIFIDQIDSLLSARSEGEQESSRKIKTEFLVELDGARTNTTERVLVIGATNRPHQLDDAVLRRFVKRLYIPLPNVEGRKQLITHLTSKGSFSLSTSDIQTLSSLTKGYSGADLFSLCSQASMVPLRNLNSIETIRNSEVPLACLRDCIQSIKLVRPSVNKKLLSTFEEWNTSFGSYQFNPDELQNDQTVNSK